MIQTMEERFTLGDQNVWEFTFEKLEKCMDLYESEDFRGI